MPSDTRAQALRALIGQDHFAADEDDFYPGMTDGDLKSRLNSIIDSAVEALSEAAANNRTDSQLLAMLEQCIQSIDRHSLDTEDAEQVCRRFEAMLDALGIESSDGILNTWMYGFDPNRI